MSVQRRGIAAIAATAPEQPGTPLPANSRGRCAKAAGGLPVRQLRSRGVPASLGKTFLNSGLRRLLVHLKLAFVSGLALFAAACASQGSNSEATSAPKDGSSPAAVASAPAGLAPSFSGGHLDGQVLGANAPIARSTVTLWAATIDSPRQMAQTQTGGDNLRRWPGHLVSRSVRRRAGCAKVVERK